MSALVVDAHSFTLEQQKLLQPCGLYPARKHTYSALAIIQFFSAALHVCISCMPPMFTVCWLGVDCGQTPGTVSTHSALWACASVDASGSDHLPGCLRALTADKRAAEEQRRREVGQQEAAAAEVPANRRHDVCTLNAGITALDDGVSNALTCCTMFHVSMYATTSMYGMYECAHIHTGGSSYQH